MWLVALPVAVTVRYDFDPSLLSLTSAAAMGALLGGLQVAIGYAINLYRGRYRVGSFDEVRGVVTTVAILAVAQFAYLVAVQPEGLPRSVAITSTDNSVSWARSLATSANRLGDRAAPEAFVQRRARLRATASTLASIPSGDLASIASHV